jgi:hypothetical protein
MRIQITVRCTGRPFFLGVGMIRPHLPFIVPTDTWALYNESEIKLPVRIRSNLNARIYKYNCNANDLSFSFSTFNLCSSSNDDVARFESLN